MITRRFLFAVAGLFLGVWVARGIGLETGEVFSFSTEGWSWQAGIVIVIFLVVAREIAERLWPPD